MEKIVLNVEGMACEHCVKAITGALNALPGIHGVAVSLSSKTVTVEYEPALCTPEKIKHEITEQGYDLV